METINAFGLACPKPLMMAKAKIDEGARELSVHVDNEIAVKNVSRLAENDRGLRICRVHWQRPRGRRRPPAWL